MTLLMSSANITGLILCGGAASRMGGNDKGLIELAGSPLVDIAIGRLSPQVQSIMLSANRNLDDYRRRGLSVLQDADFNDRHQQFQGPLAGILAGLNAMTTDWLMVVPCDCPYFPKDLVATLQQAAYPPNRAAYVEGHPVFALLPNSVKPALEQYLQQGHRKLGQWLHTIDAITISIDDETAFKNINTPEDLDR